MAIKKYTRKPFVSRDKFRAWLRNISSEYPDEVVGKARSCSSCPVASYIEAMTGRRAKVTMWHTYSGAVFNYRNPDWLCGFLYEVDRHPMDTPITAKEAYRLVNKVTRGNYYRNYA